MRSRQAIAEVRLYARKGYSRTASPAQRDYRDAARDVALRYIADEASHADMATIKRVANLALGRD